MERHDLWIFKHVAELKSFSKTAERLGYVQPNISQRIKSLEEELGVKLFVRNNRGVTLTKKGKVLLEYTNQILMLMDEAKSLINPQKWKGSLIIGASQTISAVKIPQLLSAFLKDHKGIDVKIRTKDVQKLQEMLSYGELDGVFIHGDYSNSKLETVHSYSEKIVLVSPNHIEVDNQHHQTLIVNSNTTCTYRNKMINFAKISKYQDPAILEFDSLESILQAVHDGLGISILPEGVAYNRKDTQAVHYQTLNETIRINFVIQNRKQQHPILKKFIRFLQST